MIMSHEYSHHIAGLFHGSKHTRIQFRRTGFFHAGSAQDGIFVGSCFIVFRHRNVEESKCRQWLPAVLCCIGCALLTIPVDLIEREPCVTFHILQRGVRMRVHAIQDGCILLRIGRGFHGQDIIRRKDRATIRHQIAGYLTDDVI